MAWNGVNKSILGAKATEIKDAAAAAQSKEAGDATVKTASNNQTTGDAVEATKPVPAPAPPLPSVWNGRHKNIITVKETSSAVSIPARSPSPAISSTSALSSSAVSFTSSFSKKEQLVVSSPPKVDPKSVQQLHAKEDEATNSTTGSSSRSSTTSATIDEVPALEVKVGTTEVVTTSLSSDSEKKDSTDNSSSEGKDANAASAAPTRVRSNSNINSNRQTANPNANSANARRSGNTKGGRGNNIANSHLGNTNNNSGRQNYSRGASGNGGNGRRRAINVDQPVCRFFSRGLCNRGMACTFKHEIAPASAYTPATSSDLASYQRSGTYPPPVKNNGNGNNQFLHVTASSFVMPNKRAFDPYKAKAIALVKGAQDNEDRSKYTFPAKIITLDEKKTEEDVQVVVEDPPIFSIDVECIATGYGSCAKGIHDGCGNEGRNKDDVPSDQYNDRSHRYPGRVAMVDSDGKLLADIIVRPPSDGAGVVSYLTPLTGLTAEMCLGSDAKPLDEAIGIIKALLPKNGVLVGQAIDHDVEWLGLTPGKDFDRMVDISEIFRQRMPAILAQAANALKEKEQESGGEQPSSTPASDDPSSDEHLGFATRYRHFSLRHVCLQLLGEDIQSGVHNPITDAQFSLTLFHKYRNSSVTQLRIVRDGLHRAPITPSFAQENTPVIDGVCVSAAAYPYKRAARRIWRWYSANKKQ